MHIEYLSQKAFIFMADEMTASTILFSDQSVTSAVMNWMKTLKLPEKCSYYYIIVIIIIFIIKNYYFPPCSTGLYNIEKIGYNR